jgi:hypothetical protein
LFLLGSFTVPISLNLSPSLGVVALLALGISGCSGIGSDLVVGGADLESAASKVRAETAPVRDCPEVVISDENSVRTHYAKGEEGNAKAIIYQAVITDTARECASFGATFEFRTGVRGRITPGAMAQAGQTINLNLHLTFMNNEETLWESSRPISVTVSNDLGPQEFSIIEENGTALIPEGKSEFDYKIYVSFVESGGGAKPR